MEQNTGFKWQRDDFTNITEPFKNDLLNRTPLAKHLTSYIDRLQVGAVLALDARWGEGKTWFVQHWKAHLEQPDNHHNVIYLNAFAQDYLEDPFMVLSAEITHAFDNAQDNHPLIQSFKETAINAAKALLPELPKLILSLGVTLMGAGYFGKALESAVGHVKDAVDSAKDMYGKNTFSDIRETIDANIQDAIKSRFEKHEADKQTLESFKQALRELAADVTLNPKPLVFIIDELDRCNPLFSVRMIERIKHFFDIPNIVFVLVTDKQQLQATICYQFGYNEQMGEAYLDKFIDFSIKLEKSKLKSSHLQTLASAESLLTSLGFDDDSIKVLSIDTTIYATIYNISIRQLKKILNKFSLLYLETLPQNRILLFCLCNPHLLENIPIPHQIRYACLQYPFVIPSVTSQEISASLSSSIQNTQYGYQFSTLTNEKINLLKIHFNKTLKLIENEDDSKDTLILHQMTLLAVTFQNTQTNSISHFDKKKCQQSYSKLLQMYSFKNSTLNTNSHNTPQNESTFQNHPWIHYIKTGVTE